MNTRRMFVALVTLITHSSFGIDLPAPPDTRAIAALVRRPDQPCNAAEFFLKAEEAFRPDLKNASGDRTVIAKDHPAFGLVQKGLTCARCEFPYSKEMTIPPTDQLIPMAGLYWAVAGRLTLDGRDMLDQKNFDQARELFSKTVSLGLLLYEEPGITFIQDLISLRVIAEGAKGLGDLAIAEENKDAAGTCAAFVEQSQAYTEGISRFIREQLTYEALLRNPDSQSAHIRELVDRYKKVSNPKVRLEIMLFAGLARPLMTDPDAIRELDALVAESLRDPDVRFQRLGAWIRDLDIESAREQLQEMTGSTLP